MLKDSLGRVERLVSNPGIRCNIFSGAMQLEKEASDVDDAT